jgi:L-ascorbate metabolism protein UlaG (beta-lactamase superfamily)
MSRDETVLSRVAALALGERQVAMWWHGQSSFLLRGASATVLVDPFLAAHPDRVVPPPFAPEDARGIDLVLITHDHLDHLDDAALPGIAAASPAARFVLPEPVAGRLTDLGIAEERVLPAQPGRALEVSGVRIEPVPACHGVDPADAYSFGRELSGGLVRYLGYVLDVSGVRLYHAGDTVHYDGIEETVRALAPEVALLPINGRSGDREAVGIVGNLDEREAVELAAAIGVALLVPMHFDMFAGNPGDPGKVVDLASKAHPDLAVLVLSRERPFVYTAA